MLSNLHIIKLLQVCQFENDRYACLLANHGVVAVGNDIDEAYIRSVYVEDAARILTYSKINGEPVVIDDEAIRKMLE